MTGKNVTRQCQSFPRGKIVLGWGPLLGLYGGAFLDIFFSMFKLSWCLSGKEYACQYRRHKRCEFNPWVGKMPWRRAWQPSPIFLPGESHGERSLVGYSPWGHKESDKAEVTQHTHIMGKDMATHSSILAWRIPWREEPGRLQSMGLQRVGHNWMTNTDIC